MKLLSVLVAIALLIGGCANKPKYSQLGSDNNTGINLALDNPNVTDEQRLAMIEQHNNTRIIHYGQKPAPIQDNHSYVKYRPVVDRAMCKDCDYETDVSQCQQLAGRNTRYIGNTLASAAVGAGIGAAIAAVVGVDVGIVAAGGATGGAIGGLGNESVTHYQMVVRCMQGRGYSVVR